jgi:hypothetical protein
LTFSPSIPDDRIEIDLDDAPGRALDVGVLVALDVPRAPQQAVQTEAANSGRVPVVALDRTSLRPDEAAPLRGLMEALAVRSARADHERLADGENVVVERRLGIALVVGIVADHDIDADELRPPLGALGGLRLRARGHRSSE